MPQNYIAYQSPDSGNVRKVTVVNDQPYYESTGKNSNAENVWFPFIMIRGICPIDIVNLPDIYHISYMNNIISEAPPNYILKYERSFLTEKCSQLLQPALYNGRIPTKETLIVSCRLSGKYGYSKNNLNETGLTQEEIMLAMQPITMDFNPEFISNSPDEVNKWLIKQNATIVKKLLREERTLKFEEPAIENTNLKLQAEFKQFKPSGNKYLDKFLDPDCRIQKSSFK